MRLGGHHDESRAPGSGQSLAQAREELDVADVRYADDPLNPISGLLISPRDQPGVAQEDVDPGRPEPPGVVAHARERREVELSELHPGPRMTLEDAISGALALDAIAAGQVGLGSAPRKGTSGLEADPGVRPGHDRDAPPQIDTREHVICRRTVVKRHGAF